MAILTAFGLILRRLRVEKQLTLHDLAKKMGNTPAFISAIETGRKPIPDAFVLAVSRAMELNTAQISELRKASDRTRKEVRVDALQPENRELVAAFARAVEDIPPDKLAEIKKHFLMPSMSSDEPFKRRRRGLVVPPLSRDAIMSIVAKIRLAFSEPKHPYFPIIQVLEHGLPNFIKDFYLDIRDASAMGPLEGMVISGKSSIAIREDVYIRACKGEGRSRFTCCHELGHYFLHGEVTMARIREDGDQIYCDSEWQADWFAGSLMLPRELASAFSDETDAAKQCGMTPLAAKVMLDKHRRIGQQNTLL